MGFYPRALSVLLLFCLFAACGGGSDHAGPSSALSEPDSAHIVGTVPDSLAGAGPDAGRVQALNAALDSLEALVITLERIEGPIAAWNHAGEAARLLRYLEQNRSAFAFDLPEEEAAQRYPVQVSRLNALEARRTAELERIEKEPMAMRVLLEEMAKADAEAGTAVRRGDR